MDSFSSFLDGFGDFLGKVTGIAGDVVDIRTSLAPPQRGPPMAGVPAPAPAIGAPAAAPIPLVWFGGALLLVLLLGR